MADTWTAIPAQLLDLMENAEYHLACGDAPKQDRMSALTELIEWCMDLRVFVRTGVPMASHEGK